MVDGIVFIHAFPLDASMWAPQVERLMRRTNVVAVNLPGFGGVPLESDVMTMRAAAAHVAREARDAGAARALVCGLSMGGYVALELWRQHPEQVAGFVLANTKAEGDDEAGRARRRDLAARLRAEGNGFLVENPPPLLSEGAPDELVTRVKRIIATQPAASIAAAALGMAERPDSTADLGTITVPTMVISASRDTLIPPEATKPLAGGIPGARFEMIDGVGHLSNLEAPEAFTALLLAHLERVEAADQR